MGIYNDGKPVVWGKQNLEWYVLGEFSDYYLLLLKNIFSVGIEFILNEKPLPIRWEDSFVFQQVVNFGNEQFTDYEKSVMFCDTYIHQSSYDGRVYKFKHYATLLTASQVDQFIPRGSPIRGDWWWVKKSMVYNEAEPNFIVTKNGFEKGIITCSAGIRPVIGVTKDILRKKYPAINVTVSVKPVKLQSETNVYRTEPRYSGLTLETLHYVSLAISILATALYCLISRNWWHVLLIPGVFGVLRFCLLYILFKNVKYEKETLRIKYSLIIGISIGIIALLISSVPIALTWAIYSSLVISDLLVVYEIMEFFGVW